MLGMFAIVFGVEGDHPFEERQVVGGPISRAARVTCVDCWTSKIVRRDCLSSTNAIAMLLTVRLRFVLCDSRSTS
jgi:hypothetical protein